MSLNKKELNILKELIDVQSLSITYFSKKYDVSERNIRYSIDNLNFYLTKFSFENILLKKRELKWTCSQNDLNNFIEKLNIENYSFSKEERENYILINYLFNDNTNITNLENYLKVSRPTIKKDIFSLNEYLKKFDLQFVRENNSIFINGKEKKLRHLKLLKLLDYIKIIDDKIIFLPKIYLTEKKESTIIKGYILKLNISHLYILISNIERELGITFDLQFKNLMYVYLIPTIERINKKHIIIKKNNSNFLKNLTQYKIIKKYLSEIIPQELEFEFLHLTEYFISGYYSHDFSENISLVKNFIEEFCKLVSLSLNFDFNNLVEYKDEILKYLLPAVYRIKNNFFLIKKEQIEISDIEIYKKVKPIVLSCNHILKEPFGEEEIIYLSNISNKYIHKENNTKISLKKLISIIKNNSNNTNENKLIKELLFHFKNKIEDDR